MLRDTKRFRAKVAIAAIAVTGAGLIATHFDEVVQYTKHLPGLRSLFKTSADQLATTYGTAARSRLAPKFAEKNVAYPPDRIELVAFKSTKELLVYAADKDAPFKYICRYPILGASGHLGPKLKEGDNQVPEGLYRLTLEPNTPYHAALRLNYPNSEDLARAKADGRVNPGSDILVHGTEGSIGCIAVGNPASEDLFVLAYDTRSKNLPLVIAPVDLTQEEAPPAVPDAPKWLPELYAEIKAALTELNDEKLK
jgi:murein L,D-transpeptidase YafK